MIVNESMLRDSQCKRILRFAHRSQKKRSLKFSQNYKFKISTIPYISFIGLSHFCHISDATDYGI